MIIVTNDNTNPYFNLATEEYLLKEFNEDFFMLWQNESCIVVGKNQNTMAEINVDYVKENEIKVVRRLSGGGAVFHDLGNLNFTFITGNNNSFNDFEHFTRPIIEVLNKIGINAVFSGRNDLTIDDKKFSGNAQYNYKNRVLHHGTLLFSSNITDLSAALKVNPLKFEGKGVKSVASRVTNISQHLKSPLTISEFKQLIMDHIKESYPNQRFYSLTEEDLGNISQMVEDKYSSWDWNFGKSPSYDFANSKKYSGGNVEFHMNVSQGVIRNLKVFGDFFGKNDVSDIEKALLGVPHREDCIKDALSQYNINDYFSNISLEELMEVFF